MNYMLILSLPIMADISSNVRIIVHLKTAVMIRARIGKYSEVKLMDGKKLIWISSTKNILKY